ncbi:hypothetical protein HPB48_022915 [Haemaphysalis longicornis]|uniref:Uncharacterized protein n=1 Tax=Haemaphysalis longicornis TaxID=44386 RepID=A0A9J6FNE1_HAELO|nr:hypothetical protein HPB48_022915 [Haemaphysalis longicornis]
MPENEECVCCCEKPAVKEKIKYAQNHMCVTENNAFVPYCLTPFILEIQYKKLVHYHPRFGDVKEPNA